MEPQNTDPSNQPPQSTGPDMERAVERYSNYLRLMAEIQLGKYLQSRLGASDIVQETFLEATRDKHAFRGKTDNELLGWLKQILLNNVNQAIEFHAAQKRSIRREVSLERLVAMHFSSVAIENALAAQISTPSEPARRHELLVAVADCMAKLNDDQRQVLMLRTLQGKSYADCALLLGKSVEACRMSWIRAVRELRRLFVEKNLV